MTSVVIVDDQELVRQGLRLIIGSEPDLDVVGEAADAMRGVRLAQELLPDVVLMDIRMGGSGDGIGAVRTLVDGRYAGRILMLTTFDLDEYVYDALAAGAAGFLLKDMPADDIVVAIRQAARGNDGLLAPAVTRRLIARFARSREARLGDPGMASRLTARERDVLRLVVRGLANHEIARELYISETTVKTHVARVLSKLGVRDRVQAVIFAYEHGIAGSSEETGRHTEP